MIYLLKKLYRPEYFQGDRVLRKNERLTRHGGAAEKGEAGPGGYFEGWYFKSAFSDSALALIPGISLAAEDPHCFLQVLDGESGASSYHRYPRDRFSFRSDRFEIRVGPNRFSMDGIHLELDGLRGDLQIRDTARWPSFPWSPSSMGWYSFARFMECYHGVILLDGVVEGSVDGRKLSGGRFYLEKDWGSSFPRAWIWMQSNSFGSDPGTSVTCSIARVPFRGKEFSGFIIGILSHGTLYRFTTYNGARIVSLSIGESALEVRVRRGAQELSLRARRETGAELASPFLGEMSGRIEETLGATIDVALSDGGRIVLSGTGRWAGLEVVRAKELLRGEVAIPR
jgi:tocopherol cyclase